MSLKNVTSPEKNISVLELHIDKAAFDDAVTKAYKKNVGKMNVPGFRKGKAPKSIIEKMYGAAVFYDDALDMLLPDLYASAVEEAKLEVVSRPEIDIVSIDENGVELTAKVYIKPVATVSKYKGLEAAKETVRVNKSEIEEEIELVRKRNGRQITLEDQPAADGDETVIDFEGFLDGVAFEGGKGEQYPLLLGSGYFIPGFEEQVAGAAVGEERDVNVTFPTEYMPELAGKDAVFRIKVHQITRRSLPEWNDDFARQQGFADVSALRRAVMETAVQKKQAQAAEQFANELIRQVTEGMTVTIPDAMVENQLDGLINELRGHLQAQGVSLEQYLEAGGTTMEQLRDHARQQATAAARYELAMTEIARREGIHITEEDVDAKYQELSRQYDLSVELLRQQLPPLRLRHDLKLAAAQAVVVDSAKRK